MNIEQIRSTLLLMLGHTTTHDQYRQVVKWEWDDGKFVYYVALNTCKQHHMFFGKRKIGTFAHKGYKRRHTRQRIGVYGSHKQSTGSLERGVSAIKEVLEASHE